MGGLRRFGALAVALTLVGAAAGCGDDDSGSDEDSAEETTTTEEEGSEDEGSESEDEDSSGDVDLDSGAVDFGNLEECLEFAGAYASLGLVFLGGAFGGEGAEDIDVDEIIGEVEAVASEAPDDVQDAFDTVISTYQDVFENMEDAGVDLNDAFDFTDPDLAEAMEPLNSDDFNEANNEVSAFLDEQCAG